MNDFPAIHGFGRLIGKSSSACCVSAHDGSTVRVLQVIITLLIDDPGRTQEAARGYVGTTYTMANGSCGEPMTIDRLLHVLRENVVDARGWRYEFELLEVASVSRPKEGKEYQ